MFNILIFALLLVSLSLIIVVLYRKIPLLKQIELEEVEQEKKKKYTLLEQRLRRKIDTWFSSVKVHVPFEVVNTLRDGFLALYHRTKKKKHTYIEETKVAEGEETLEEQEINKLEAARVFLEKAKFTEAEEAALSIIKKNPKSLSTYKLLAEIYLQSKNFLHVEATREHIIQLAKRLKELRPIDYLDLARIKLKLDKVEEALQHAKKAISLEPLNPKILHFLVKTCIVCKQKDLAWKYYRKLREVNSGDEGLDELLEELKSI